MLPGKVKISGEEKTVAKNYGALVVLQALNYLLPLLIIPFLERQLGLEKFGLVMLAQYLMAFCVAFADFGFNVTATREISILKAEKGDYSSVYFKVFWARMILLVVVFILLSIIIFSIPRFSVEWHIYLLSYGAVIGQTLLPDWFFQGIEKMRLLTVINVIAKLIFTILLFVFISQPADYTFVPVFNSIGFLVAGFVTFFLSMKYVTWQWPNFKGSKEFYKESFQIFISNIASQLSNAANGGVILGFFGGDAIVGVFSAFDKLIIAAKKMYLPFYQAMYPYLARKSFNEKLKMMKKLIPVITIIGIIGFSIIFLMGDWIIQLLYKDNAIYENIYLFKWMGLIAFFTGLSLLFHSLYAPARKLFNDRMKMTITAGIFNIILSLIIVPIYGLKGTVISVICTEFLLLGMATLFYYKDLKKSL
ncbi:membrane protein [Nonlabens ulvanivorans]|nr:oligosaccharide flippase family protein [Nonlabens ulvanivorans]GAK88229.1 membrane protein [Nonlabens ulvanivorans]